MNEWIHCNHCYCQPSVDKSFNLTNCGHLYCETCLNKNNRKCFICKTDCVAIPLASELKPDVAIFLSNPIDLNNKLAKDMKRVVDFQNSHLARLLSYKQRMADKTTQLADEYKKLYKENRDLKRTLERQQQEGNQDYDTLKRNYDKICQEYEQARKQIELLKNQINKQRIASLSNCNRNGSQTSMDRPSPSGLNLATPFNFGNNFRSTPGSNGSLEHRGVISSSPATRLTLETPPILGRMGLIRPSPRNNNNHNTGTTPSLSGLRILTPSPSMSQRTQQNRVQFGQNSSLTQRGGGSGSVFQTPFQPNSSENFRGSNVTRQRKARISPYSPV